MAIRNQAKLLEDWANGLPIPATIQVALDALAQETEDDARIARFLKSLIDNYVSPSHDAGDIDTSGILTDPAEARFMMDDPDGGDLIFRVTITRIRNDESDSTYLD